MDAFALGAYISRFPISRAKTQFFVLLAVLPLVGFAAQYLATGEIGAISAFGYPLLLPEAYQFIWGYTLLNYLFAVVIYGVARERWAVRFLEQRPLRYLGRISYGLYVYHYPIVWFAGRIADLGVEPPIHKPLTALIALAGTILMASLSYSLIEHPVLNLKDRYFSLRQPQRQETPLAAPAEP
jgi:peptidoglycan/LPS O-acetylase OafA/YrhL